MGATDEPIFVHTGSAPEEAMEALTAAVLEHKPALAIIDPLLRLIRLRDVNDYALVNREMEPLVNLARTSGTHLFCVHHAGKGDRLGGDGVLGSTALFGAVDALLLMRRKDNVRTLETIHRYGEDMPETVVTMDPITGIITAGGTVEEALLEQASAQVMAELGHIEELTEQEIRDRAGGNTGLIGKALRRLVADGHVLRDGNGKRGSPFTYRKPPLEAACPL